MAPNIIFGTATFGADLSDFQDHATVKPLFETLRELGIQRLDSGARYPPLKPGRAEEILGEAKELFKGFTLDTKVYTDTRSDGSGDLTQDAIEMSLSASLQRLQRPGGVDILHAHRGDPSTPLEEQIRGFTSQIEQGHCQAWGVSNVVPPMLEEILQICEKQGLPKPVCYQGDYNVATRGMEMKLLPILRAHQMAFNAFRPLAAGFLTGKLINNEHAGTRFGDDNPIGKFARMVYDAEDLHSAMKEFDVKARSMGLKPMEVAIRWIIHHSALQEADGVVIGASKTEQVRELVALIRKGPLPEDALKLTEDLWSAVKESRAEII